MSRPKRPRRTDEMERVFRALADRNRRRILDIVKSEPGLSVSGLADHFNFSRFAVMKHLRVLEGAGLLTLRKDGRQKKIYLNAIPIQMIYDRWLSDFSRHWAGGLTRLKYTLEGTEDDR